MHRIILAAILLVSSALVAAGGAVAQQAGKPAPDFELPRANGDKQKLADLKGKVVYLDFWASWCGPCRKTFPWMNAMQKKYGPQGLAIVAVNVDENRKDADEFLAKLPAEFTVLFDAKQQLAKTYDLKGMPSAYLIDRNGVVKTIHAGFKESQIEELEASVKAALGLK